MRTLTAALARGQESAEMAGYRPWATEEAAVQTRKIKSTPLERGEEVGVPDLGSPPKMTLTSTVQTWKFISSQPSGPPTAGDKHLPSSSAPSPTVSFYTTT